MAAISQTAPAVQNTRASTFPPGAGVWSQRLRAYTGLILFTFATTHLLNHSLGLVSIDVMETVRLYRVAITRSWPGTILIAGSLIIHMWLALQKFAQRRTWRMTIWEATQLTFGLVIPLLLFRHIAATRMLHELFDINDNYSFMLWIMWPGEAYRMMGLIFLVWVHGCIGIHFWLRMKDWYIKYIWVTYAVAVLIPVLAFAGFTAGARAVKAAGIFRNGAVTQEQYDALVVAKDSAFQVWIAILVLISAYHGLRYLYDRRHRKIKVSYLNGRDVQSEIGPTLLEISRANGIPHASVCGGRARCSTCRVRVIRGLDTLPSVSAVEQKVLSNISAAPDIRLACQLMPHGDIEIATLMPAKLSGARDAIANDKFEWGVEQEVTLMFADLRGFTAASEDKLPYDVVFMLNQYLGQMSGAIENAGGYVDKFIGDGIMAIYGIDQYREVGAKTALRAARAMGDVLTALNQSLAADLVNPLSIGIGIHTGSAVLGRVGVAGTAAQNGGKHRITALGDTVNTASRLETACKPLKAQLVVSAHTMTLAGITLDMGRTEHITVKGKRQKIPVHAFHKAMDLPANII
ncbi:MAG: adenylate/guanylate cyclase domain-containing protein [Fimbriimonadaceae bacterium]|nr:adenylate/guanylate cyclase domain-containing protein [Alphaproteobacteria bacterium]